MTLKLFKRLGQWPASLEMAQTGGQWIPSSWTHCLLPTLSSHFFGLFIFRFILRSSAEMLQREEVCGFEPMYFTSASPQAHQMMVTYRNCEFLPRFSVKERQSRNIG